QRELQAQLASYRLSVGPSIDPLTSHSADCPSESARASRSRRCGSARWHGGGPANERADTDNWERQSQAARLDFHPRHPLTSGVRAQEGRPMMADWIYNSPTWLWGGILVAVFTAAACGGLLVFHRLVGLDVRQAHNDLAGFTLAVVGVVYAVLLAFIAIATWEAFSKADEIVENESDFAGDIYLDTQGLPGASGQAIRNDVAEYVRTVIEEEWPTQRTGKTPEQGWKPLRDLNSAIATL